MTTDARLGSPSARRNRDPILDVLRTVLPATGTILEIASGSGEHVVHFAAAFPDLTWQPSDPSAEARASIAAWIAHREAANIRAPLAIDATAESWPVDRADALIAINMVHISPWIATLGLLRHAGHLLPVDGPLLLYGPYRQAGQVLAAGNAAFDADLRVRNAEWGLRAVEDVAHEARSVGMELDRIVEMPANNLSVVFRRKR